MPTELEEAQPAIFKTDQLTPIRDLKLLVKDYPPIAASALTILINISTDPEILKSLSEDDAFLDNILNRITDPKETNATLHSMLLSNLAKSDSLARLLILKRPTVRTLDPAAKNAFDQLLDLFNKGVDGRNAPRLHRTSLQYPAPYNANPAPLSSIPTPASSSRHHLHNPQRPSFSPFPSYSHPAAHPPYPPISTPPTHRTRSRFLRLRSRPLASGAPTFRPGTETRR
ncbi:MAG: hypothetical protein L6R40_005981 [Gallowayella cf. fulva]|nr:MAG: hypothetical protein L6R40_005981 [Xanthomendoza cf. fulva]